MSDLKSKIPDLNEITSMAGKLFQDVKKSITEIIADYKTNHPVTEVKAETTEETKEEVSSESKTEVSESKESEEQTQEETKNTDKE